MDKYWILIGLLSLLSICCRVKSIRWIVLTNVTPEAEIRNRGSCETLKGLTKPQKNICRKNLDSMQALVESASETVKECLHQFENRRWNCTTLNQPYLIAKKLAGTRETAYIYALSAAATAHSITRQCGSGSVSRCGCDNSVQKPDTRGEDPRSPAAMGFTWSGCPLNIAYGTSFSQLFTDSQERGGAKNDNSASIALMNIHNNKAGREAVRRLMKIQCKCHGVSGSCEVRTCWKDLPSIRSVGSLLMERFEKAVPVRLARFGTRSELIAEPGHIWGLSPRVNHVPQTAPPSLDDISLVYLKESPNFCEPLPGLQWGGTRGRGCVKGGPGPENCDHICCGRGYHSYRQVATVRCQCRFQWCCEVRCKQCKSVVDTHVCR